MLRLLFYAVLVLFIAARLAHSAVTVEGLEDRTMVTGQVRFRVLEDPPGEWSVKLDGISVPFGEWIDESTPGYHELSLEPVSPTSTESPALFRFVVRDPLRGSSETGLPPWTPPAPIPAHRDALAGLRLEIFAPRTAPSGTAIPMAAFLRSQNGLRAPFHASVFLEGGASEPLILRRGAGSILVPAPVEAGEALLQPVFPGASDAVSIRIEQDTGWSEGPARIETGTAWPPGSRVRLSEDLEIASGASLTIGTGSWIVLGPGVDLTIAGALHIEGTLDDPVVFASADPSGPWGGALVQGAGAQVTARAAFFTGGGGDPNWFSGSGFSAHRQEQALFLFDTGTSGAFEDCWFIRNPGQIFHGRGAGITLDRCLVQQAQTTGQFNGGNVRLTGCALIEFPAASAQFADADNDAIYFTSGSHELRDTLIGWAKDDGVDAGSGDSGSVAVTRCWVESCFHEGFAWSGNGRIASVADTVVLTCGQGIETGFGDPSVAVARSLTAGNLVGLRFGDNYDWDYNGFLEVRESYSVYNERDVWGRDWDSWEENLDRMDLRENLFAEADPLHPDNGVWDPDKDATALAQFSAEALGPVGAGFAEFSVLRDRGALGEPLRVGLSGLSSRTVRVAWRAIGKIEAGEAPGNTLAAGELEFPPGNTLATLDLSSISDAVSPFVAVVLRGAEADAITGQAAVYYGALPAAAASDTLVELESAWNYLDGGAVPDPEWFNLDFDDSEWKNGQAEFGFGDDDENTEIDGGTEDARHPVVYFRRSFMVIDPSAYSSLRLRVRRDDGAMVYLNGREVFRTNMPDGPIGSGTWALDSTGDENGLREKLLDPAELQPGDNVLAVSVHQSDPESSDLSFDLELVAFLKGSEAVVWDRSAGLEAYLWNGVNDGAAVLEHAASLGGAWQPLSLPGAPAVFVPRRGVIRAAGTDVPFGDGTSGFVRARPGAG